MIPIDVAGAVLSCLLSAASPAQSRPAGVPLVPVQKVVCETEDAVKVAGVFVPPRTRAGEKAPVVILVHDFESDKSCWEPLHVPLHEAGFAVLAVDLRGHGDTAGAEGRQFDKRSGKRDTRLFRQMYKDVLAGYNWLTARPDVDLSRYVLVGAGLGASVALDCAAHDRSIDGVVCLSPETASLGLDALADAAKYGKRPILLLATQADAAAAAQLTKLIPGATTTPVGAEGSGNPRDIAGVGMLGRVPGIERQIVDFLLKAAGPAPQELVVASTNSEVYHRPDAATVQKIKVTNLRRFSSPTEAEERGLRASRARDAGGPPTARTTRSRKATPG